MASVAQNHRIDTSVSAARTNWAILCGIAAAFALLHILTNNRYGFHRDELQFLSDARHLDWGYVSYPPFTPVVERIALGLFGMSLVGLRLFSVIAQALVILVSGLMARDLGGGRLAQVATCLAVGLSGLPLFEATEFQYTTFSFFWWILVCWFAIRLLKSEKPRWWVAIGTCVGFALLTKYSIVFFIAGLLAGVVFTPVRSHFRSRWFWAGVGIALLLFLPNLIWLVRHDFISYTFLQQIHKRDVGEGRAAGYWKYQFLLDINSFAVPLWLAGLIACARSSRYRMLAWMYVIPVLAFWVGKGRFYYLAEAYPVLLAMGAVVGERWLAARAAWLRRSLAGVFFAGLLGFGAYYGAIIVPFATRGPLRDFALARNGDLREEIGWDDLVVAVAHVRDSLSAEQQSSYGILVGNYGEAGAIENLGGAYHLPSPISVTNSGYLRSYPASPPSTLIVVGWSKSRVEREFTGCRVAGHIGNSLGVKNEESQDHPGIYVCGPPLAGWPEFWRRNQWFG